MRFVRVTRPKASCLTSKPARVVCCDVLHQLRVAWPQLTIETVELSHVGPLDATHATTTSRKTKDADRDEATLLQQHVVDVMCGAADGRPKPTARVRRYGFDWERVLDGPALATARETTTVETLQPKRGGDYSCCSRPYEKKRRL